MRTKLDSVHMLSLFSNLKNVRVHISIRVSKTGTYKPYKYENFKTNWTYV